MSSSAEQSGPRIFFSVGDLSGDQHGANLIHSMKQLCPTATFEGFGGELMQKAGCNLHFPLCDLAVMGLVRVLKNLRTFLRLKNEAVRHFDTHRPDALVLIDYPGFNLWLAKSAKQRGIPVHYFIPPQLWAWGGWRVKKVRRRVDHVYSCLPFEQQWYQERNVNSSFVGHPYFDELRENRLDGFFVAEQQSQAGPIVGLLPGSRDQELQRHVSVLFDTASIIHCQRPDVRFLVACLKESHADQVRQRWQQWKNSHPHDKLRLEVIAGKTPEIIHLAHSCISASGSVSLELLYRSTPTVIVYQVSQVDCLLARALMRCRYITLVNLLADRELFPEYLKVRLSPDQLAGHVLEWLQSPKKHATLRGELDRLRDQVAEPGACHRTAEQIMSSLMGTQRKAA